MKAKTLLLSVAMLSAGFTAEAVEWNDPVSVYPNPSEVVTDISLLQDIRINYGPDWEFTVGERASAYLMNMNTFMPVTCTSIYLWDFALQLEGSYYLKIEFPEITENGTYELSIDGNSMYHDGEGNYPIRFTYTVNDPTLNQEEIPELEVLSVIPEAGSSLPTIGLTEGEGREYIFDTNINKHIGYATAFWYDVTDPMVPEYITQTYCNREPGDENPVTFLKWDDIKMYKGHIYELTVYYYDSYGATSKELGNTTVKYAGTSDSYVYATQKAIGINPDPNNYVIDSPEHAQFTVIFDGSVDIDMDYSRISLGPLGYDYYSSVTSNDAKTEWTFVIPSSMYSDASITCSVVARDEEGRTVRGDEFMSQFESSSDNTAGFMFTFSNDMSGVVLGVTPAEGDVTSLKSFTLTAPEGYADMMPSWTAYPYLVRDQETVYTFNHDEDFDFSVPGTIVMAMPEEITEAGRYALIIPANSFMCTDEWGNVSDGNKQMTLSYFIMGEAGAVVYDIEPLSITPAPGEVTELRDFKITFSGVEGPLTFEAYILDSEGKELVKTWIYCDEDFFNVDDYYLYLGKDAITEPGEYTLYIPQGAFGDMEYLDTMGESGRASKEIRENYTIISTGVDGIEADSLAGDVYNTSGVLVLRNATSADIKALAKGLYIIGGKKVIVK